jgi:hypothetical protein
MKYACLDPVPMIISSLRKPTCLRGRERVWQKTYASRIARTSRTVPVPPMAPLASSWREIWRQISLLVTTLLSPCRPRRSIHIRIHTRHLVHFRVLTKHGDLPPPYAKRLLSICMQSTLNAMAICKNDARASSVRWYEYARDLAKTLEDGADVGFDGVWW